MIQIICLLGFLTCCGLTYAQIWETSLPISPGFGTKLELLHPSFNKIDLTPADSSSLKVSGIDEMPDGRIAVCTWEKTGSVYLVTPHSDPKEIIWKRYAWGLHEPLGLEVVDGEIYVLQKQELTRLRDRDNDGFAETHECISNSWEVSSNFHEFSFGPIYKDGGFFVALAVAIQPGGATTKPQVKDRGTVVRIDPKTGDYEIISAGHRTPNGLGIGPEGDVFVSDNQGDWLPGNKIIHVRKDIFNGHRYEPAHPFTQKPNSPPALWLQQNEFSNSPTQPCYFSKGVYAEQLLYGDIHYGGIQRGAMEKIEGEWQGSAHRFTAGLQGSVNRMLQTSDGKLWLGQLGVSGNWMEPGKRDHGLEILVWNHQPCFDLVSASARSNGFMIHFSEALEEKNGWDVNAYSANQWRIVPTAEYGGPKVDEELLSIRSATVTEDRKSVFLEIPNMKAERCVMIRLHKDFRSASGRKLWSGDALYTLNRIPKNFYGTVKKAPDSFTRYEAQTYTMEHPGAAIHRAYCASCHSSDGTQLVGPSFKNLFGSTHHVISAGARREITVNEDYLIQSIIQPEADIREGYQAIMPNLSSTLGQQDLISVIEYIKSLTKNEKSIPR